MASSSFPDVVGSQISDSPRTVATYDPVSQSGYEDLEIGKMKNGIDNDIMNNKFLHARDSHISDSPGTTALNHLGNKMEIIGNNEAEEHQEAQRKLLEKVMKLVRTPAISLFIAFVVENMNRTNKSSVELIICKVSAILAALCFFSTIVAFWICFQNKIVRRSTLLGLINFIMITLLASIVILMLSLLL